MPRSWIFAILPFALACSDSIPDYPSPGGGGATNVSGTPVTHTLGTCSLATGLVGWWPGEGNTDDIAGSANGAWETGLEAYAQGKIGQGFAFDGSGFIRAAFTQAGGPTTVDLWASSSKALEAMYDAAFSTGDMAAAPYFQIDSDGSGNYRFYAQKTLILGPIVNGTWQHLAVTFDGSTVTTYVNGVLATSTSWKSDQALAFATLKIGSNRDTSDYFDGVIDEVHVWNRALSASEVATLAAVNGESLCE